MARQKKTDENLPAKAAGAQLPADWQAELEGFATEATAQEAMTGGLKIISLQGGSFKYEGNALPNPLPLVVLGASWDYAWYSQDFNPAVKQSPDCWAVGYEQGSLYAAEAARNRQGTDPANGDYSCAGCWANAFGSAKTGRGKACRDYRRLIVLSADDLQDVREGNPVEVPVLKLPPTALNDWAKYAKGLANGAIEGMKLPPFAVVTEIEIYQKGGAFSVRPKFVESFAHDRELVSKVKAVREANMETLLVGYPNFEDSNQQQQQPAGRPAQARRAAAPAASAEEPAAAPAGKSFGRTTRQSSGAAPAQQPKRPAEPPRRAAGQKY